MRTTAIQCILVLLIAATSYAQQSVRDTSISMVQITASYSYQLPTGDLSLRFGPVHNIGLDGVMKFKSNYLLGAQGSFLFGNVVNEPGLLRNVMNPDGVILDEDGVPASVLAFERGYTIQAYAGRLLAIVGPNPNSGLLIKLGGGYMRHRIRLESQNNTIPQIEGENEKGYDRLTAGPMGMFSVGYQHIGNRRLINFYFGFETWLGFTQALRPIHFDTGEMEDRTRTDGITGFRAGWTLPIYKRKAEDFYIY